MKLVIFGSGEHGFQSYHILRHDKKIEILGFLDDDTNRHGGQLLGLPIFGGVDSVPELIKGYGLACALVAVGDNAARARKTAQLRAAGLAIASAIHPNALIDSPAHIGAGVIVEMGAAIHPGATVGDGTFIGGGAIISHHSTVGAFCLIGGGVVFGGRISVGDRSLLGVGTSIQPHVKIGSNVVTGVGTTVIADLPDNVVAVGTPAKIIRTRPADA